MKKFKLIVWAALVSIAPLLQSCLDTDDNLTSYFPDNGKLAIATVRVPDKDAPRDFYFALDNGDKLIPSDTTAIKNFPATNDQRVFVGYVKTDELTEKNALSGIIFSVENILTKNTIPLTTATADSIGDNEINVTTYWVKDNFLTIEYQYLGSANPDKKHMLNLVQNQTTESTTDDGYLHLEFRHNAFDDQTLKTVPGIVSFKTDSIADQLTGKKGLMLRVKTIYDGIQYFKVDF